MSLHRHGISSVAIPPCRPSRIACVRTTTGDTDMDQADRPCLRPLPSLLLLAALTASGSAYATPGAAACAALKATTSIPNTVVTRAEYVAGPNGNYCEIDATVAPQHDMRVRLPDLWQHRYVQWGGGGFDGAITSLDMPGR